MTVRKNAKRKSETPVNLYLQDVFLCPVKEEDNPVTKRRGLVGQRVEDFQHHGAAHRIVTGT